jgi:hypothetical protein
MTEWKKSKETEHSIIFTTKWKRVILDEGTSKSDTHLVERLLTQQQLITFETPTRNSLAPYAVLILCPGGL